MNVVTNGSLSDVQRIIRNTGTLGCERESDAPAALAFRVVQVEMGVAEFHARALFELPEDHADDLTRDALPVTGACSDQPRIIPRKAADMPGLAIDPEKLTTPKMTAQPSQM